MLGSRSRELWVETRSFMKLEGLDSIFDAVFFSLSSCEHDREREREGTTKKGVMKSGYSKSSST